MPELQSVSTTPQPLPAGPRGLPVLGSLLDAWNDPLELFLRGRAAHGRIVNFKFLSLNYVLISSAEGIKHVLVDNAKNYHKSANYDGLKVLLGNGLLTSEGEFWKRQRRLSQPAFHRDRLTSFATTMVNATDLHLESWDQHKASGEPFDLHEEMMRLTLRIVGLTLFGVDVTGKNAAEVGDAVTVAIHWANNYVNSVVRLPPSIPLPRNLKFRRAMRTLYTLVDGIIAQRRKSPSTEHRDLLAMYMEATDADTGEKMSDQQLRDEVMTLILAGHETTANALTWTFYCLSQNPDVQKKLSEEITRVLGDRAPTFEDVKSLEYTAAVVQESMRLYPPVWTLEREAMSDDVVDGYQVPKGHVASVSPYVLHRDPEYWPDPERFDPERFSQAQVAARPKHVYLPFGAGPRVCIGNMFAMMEAQLLLARITQRYQLEHVVGHPVVPDPTVTLRPKYGMLMRVAR